MEKISYIVKASADILKNVKLNLDEIYIESSQQMRPKTKSSKLTAILKNIETITSHAGN